MVSVAPDGSVARQQAVHGARDANRQAAYTTLECSRRRRFHQQVQMIPLNAELKNAEPRRRRRNQRGPDSRKKSLRTEGAETGGGS
jgi:hypothetical protein